MEKPLIGLTSSRVLTASRLPAFGTNIPYVASITDSGGLPVLIPLNIANDDLDVLVNKLDGILFTGGYDIDPREYGSRPHPKVEGIDADRDRVEIHLLQALIRVGKPFLGICRGCQVINVALGGTLYEDLPEQFSGRIKHDNHDQNRDFLAHHVEIDPNSNLATLLKTADTEVNSLHHQGVRQLAKTLQAAAIAPDGLIEAFEMPKYPFGLAVQWHPEELIKYDPMRTLYTAFVESCQLVQYNPDNQGIL